MKNIALFECLLKIRNYPEFEAFRDYLNQELKQVDQLLRDTNDDRTMHVLQGEARRLDSLVKAIDGSAGVLDKHRRATGF